MIEWPRGAAEPVKYWLSNMPADTTLTELVRVAKGRWRIERDYQELKQEFGLSQYEGRGWRGFHHHATLCIAAYGFLVGQRLRGVGQKKPLRTAKTCLTRSFPPTRRRNARNDTWESRSRHYAGCSATRSRDIYNTFTAEKDRDSCDKVVLATVVFNSRHKGIGDTR